jgi:UPF0755 protein
VTPTDDGGHDEPRRRRPASPSTPESRGTDSPTDSLRRFADSPADSSADSSADLPRGFGDFADSPTDSRRGFADSADSPADSVRGSTDSPADSVPPVAESATESVPRRGGGTGGTPTPRPRARVRADRARRRRRTWAVVGVLAVLVLPFLVAGGWFLWQLHPPGGEGARVAVEIKPGWGAKEAGDELQSRGVIGSSLAFQVWEKVSGGSFQAGGYQLHEGMGVSAASDALARGPGAAASNGDHTVLTLPPGLRLEQIADRVGALPGHDRAAFLALARSGQIRSRYQGDQTSVEGFTWPDTYFVEHQTDAQILQTIVSEFDRHADAVNLARAPSVGLTPQQAVVEASLVQAEAGTPADAPKIAAVIANRLKQGTALQIDATLCYAKGGCPPIPTNADKKLDSPYNTYRGRGLPPTPIMTVTEQSMCAALAPADVPYLFYVTGKDGVTYYATTLAEHEANIRAHGVRGE